MPKTAGFSQNKYIGITGAGSGIGHTSAINLER